MPSWLGDPFTLGVTAANNGRNAATCPFPTGAGRKEWLAGFISIEPSLTEEKQRPARKASATRKSIEQFLDLELGPSSRSVSSFLLVSASATNAEAFVSKGQQTGFVCEPIAVSRDGQPRPLSAKLPPAQKKVAPELPEPLELSTLRPAAAIPPGGSALRGPDHRPTG